MVTIAVVVYMRFGRSSQYDTYIAQAQVLRQQAMGETNPVEQREAWSNVLQRVAQAELYNVTSETIAMRQEAQARLDALLGVTRLHFSSRLWHRHQGPRSAAWPPATATCIMLDATQGKSCAPR